MDECLGVCPSCSYGIQLTNVYSNNKSTRPCSSYDAVLDNATPTQNKATTISVTNSLQVWRLD
jgi:hypothetical protein